MFLSLVVSCDRGGAGAGEPIIRPPPPAGRKEELQHYHTGMQKHMLYISCHDCSYISLIS